MHAIAPLNMSATIAGYDCAVGKYAWNFGLCQCVTCEQFYLNLVTVCFCVSSIRSGMYLSRLLNTENGRICIEAIYLSVLSFHSSNSIIKWGRCSIWETISRDQLNVKSWIYFELLTPGIITLSMSVMISFHSSGLCGASEGKRGFIYPGTTVGSTRLKIYDIYARVIRICKIKKDVCRNCSV